MALFPTKQQKKIRIQILNDNQNPKHQPDFVLFRFRICEDKYDRKCILGVVPFATVVVLDIETIA